MPDFQGDYFYQIIFTYQNILNFQNLKNHFYRVQSSSSKVGKSRHSCIIHKFIVHTFNSQLKRLEDMKIIESFFQCLGQFKLRLFKLGQFKLRQDQKPFSTDTTPAAAKLNFLFIKNFENIIFAIVNYKYKSFEISKKKNRGNTFFSTRRN